MKPRPSPPSPVAASAVTIVVSRPLFLGLAGVLLGPWLAWLGILVWQGQTVHSSDHSVAPRPDQQDQARRGNPSESEVDARHSTRVRWCRPGPWGNIMLTRISIEMPNELVFFDAEGPPAVQWFVGGCNRPQALERFRQAGLTAEQFEQLSDPTIWREEPPGAWATPPESLVLDLSPAARAHIYNQLAVFPENEAQRSAFTYRPEMLDERIEDSGLQAETIERFRKMLYPRGKSLLFADTIPLLRQLTGEEAKRRFIKTVSRKNTVLAKLRVDEQTDVDALVRYWGVGGRSKDLRSLLESLSRVEGGCYIDVVHLLPALARRRIYTFPSASEDSRTLQPDCHWTALNFFNDPPDDRLASPEFASSVVRSEYSAIAAPGQLGDVVFVADASGEAIHSAVYIADDLVFTKNGARFTEPWTLMNLDDMLAIYAAAQPPNAPLKVLYYRHHRL